MPQSGLRIRLLAGAALLAAAAGGPARAEDLRAARSAGRSQFAELKGEGTPRPDEIPARIRERLAEGFLALAEASGRLNAALGLE